VAPFQPFKSRQGQDVVYALRCTYAWPLVEQLKQILRAARYVVGGPGASRKNQGGWLAVHKAWFVEPKAWPFVRRCLVAEGYRLLEDPRILQDLIAAGYPILEELGLGQPGAGTGTPDAPWPPPLGPGSWCIPP
jgi:hypothetical protein